jgi:hypothetical protein
MSKPTAAAIAAFELPKTTDVVMKTTTPATAQLAQANKNGR